jgi:hypothetical protein
VVDAINVGVLTKAYPVTKIKAVLKSTGKSSTRERELPAHVVVYYVLALTLCMPMNTREVLRWLLEGIQYLLRGKTKAKVTGKSGISQARQRVGWEPLKRLHDEMVGPVAQPETRGAWYREWRLVSLDGSTMEVADTAENEKEFGRPGASRGMAAFPHLRFVALVENGTHCLFGTQMGRYASAEVTLAKEVVKVLQKGMLCLADREFLGYELWNLARHGGADLLWRAKKNLRLECVRRLPDGSYLSYLYPSQKDRKNHTRAVAVRVIEYRLHGVKGSEPFYRLLTTILDHQQAPAKELAVLYHERWEIEGTLDEIKVHLRGARMVLRSKIPDLVKQEFYGFLLTHFAIRGLMHEAALSVGEDPDRLSFVHAVQVIRRKLFPFIISPLSPACADPSSGPEGNLGGTGQQQPWSAYPPRSEAENEQVSAPTENQAASL